MTTILQQSLNSYKENKSDTIGMSYLVIFFGQLIIMFLAYDVKHDTE